MPTAILKFRTIANGAYKYIKSNQRRGYWRVLVVNDINGSTSVNSLNVIKVLESSAEGIDGVSDRSKYCLDHEKEHLQEIANNWNAAQ